MSKRPGGRVIRPCCFCNHASLKSWKKKKRYSSRHSQATGCFWSQKISPKCNYVIASSCAMPSETFFCRRFIYGLASALSPVPLKPESTELPSRLLTERRQFTSSNVALHTNMFACKHGDYFAGVVSALSSCLNDL